MTVVRIRESRTGDRKAFDDAYLSDASRVFLKRTTPYRYETATVDKDESNDFDIDLRVGQAWAKDWQQERPHYYAVPSTGIVIPPGGTVIIEVDEEIRIPANRFGILFPKARLVFRTGLYPLTTKVDPTYSGYLKLLLHNNTTESRTLLPGEPIASLLLLRTDHAVAEIRPYDPPAEALEARGRVGNRVQYLLTQPTMAAIIGSTFGAVLSAVLVVVLT